MNHRVMGLVLTSCFLAACGSRPSDDDAEDRGAIVGVTDLQEMEQLMGLTLDREVDGAWSRGDDRLMGGACWQARFGAGAPEPQNWELRRYTEGAAFFRKLNSGPASGDQRPVACLDLDGAAGVGQTTSIDGFGLDLALRYRLGRYLGTHGAAGQQAMGFSSSRYVRVWDAVHLCGWSIATVGVERGEVTPSPPRIAYRDAFWPCADGGGDFTTCSQRGYEACVAGGNFDIAFQTLDRPSYGAYYVLGMPERIVVPQSQADISSEVAMLAYKYAWNRGAERNAFSMADDPVGHFLGSDTLDQTVIGRFERADVHHFYDSGHEMLVLTPKGKDDSPYASALVKCRRGIRFDLMPADNYTCIGL